MDTVPYVEHVNLSVRNIEEALGFLRAALPEFEVRGGGVTDHGSWKERWLHFGSDATYVALQEAPVGSHDGRTPYLAPGYNHVGFVVDDIEALRARLREAGYGEGEMAAPHPYRMRIYFLDHDSNEYEFVQYTSDDPRRRNDYAL